MAKVQKAVWAEEKAEVEVLLARRDEHANIGRRLKTLQASVEGGGRTVRDGMGQVHSNTNQHQIKIHSMLPNIQINANSNVLFKTSRSLSSTLTRCLSQDKTKERKRGLFGLGEGNPWNNPSFSLLTKIQTDPSRIDRVLEFPETCESSSYRDGHYELTCQSTSHWGFQRTFGRW